MFNTDKRRVEAIIRRAKGCDCWDCVLLLGRVPLALWKVQPSLPRSLGSRASGVTAASSPPSTRRGQAPPPDSRRTRPPLSNLPVLVCPQPLRGASSQHTRRFNPFQHLPLFRPPLNWLRLLRQLGFHPTAPSLRGFFRAAPPRLPFPPFGCPSPQAASAGALAVGGKPSPQAASAAQAPSLRGLRLTAKLPQKPPRSGRAAGSAEKGRRVCWLPAPRRGLRGLRM